MDPFLMALIIAWFVCRGAFEDARYMVTGKPSPRQLYRQKHGPSAMGEIGNAIGERIADRIRKPPPVKETEERPTGWEEVPREKKWSWRDLWEDAKLSAEEYARRYEERRKRKSAKGSTPPDGESATAEDAEDRPRWWRWSWPKGEEPPEATPEAVQWNAERTDRPGTVRTALPAGADADRERAGDPEREPAGTPGEVPRFDGQPQATRRWDGKPESDADRRFYDLRESGYTGAINQDGYPVTSGPDVDILDDLAARTERRLAEERAAGGGGAVVPGEVLDDGLDRAVPLRSFRGVEVAIPPGVWQTCPRCGRAMEVKDDLQIGEHDAGGRVGVKCACGVETVRAWRIGDQEFEGVFGYSFGGTPDAEDDTQLGAQASTTNVPGHLNPEGSPAEKEGAHMSAPVAEHGLAAFQGYVSALDESCDEAITSLEQTIASMVTDGFSGEAIAGLEEAMDDLFPAIKGALARVAAALEQSNTVKDAYQGAMHTGHRDSVLAE